MKEMLNKTLKTSNKNLLITTRLSVINFELNAVINKFIQNLIYIFFKLKDKNIINEFYLSNKKIRNVHVYYIYESRLCCVQTQDCNQIF